MGRWQEFVALNRFAAREAWTGGQLRAIWRVAHPGWRVIIVAYLGGCAVLIVGGGTALIALAAR